MIPISLFFFVFTIEYDCSCPVRNTVFFVRSLSWVAPLKFKRKFCLFARILRADEVCLSFGGSLTLLRLLFYFLHNGMIYYLVIAILYSCLVETTSVDLDILVKEVDLSISLEYWLILLLLFYFSFFLPFCSIEVHMIEI